MKNFQKNFQKVVDKSGKAGIIGRVEKKLRSVGQGVKTPPFHGGNTGSNPVRTMGMAREVGTGKKDKKDLKKVLTSKSDCAILR